LVEFLVDFFFGLSFFLGDFEGDLGDLVFFGDSLFFGDFVVVLALATLAFLGDVASFLGLVVVFLVEVVVEVFLATVVFLVSSFFGDLAFVVVVFFGDLGVIDVFLELDVDLFFGDDGAVVEDPEVPEVVVEVFLVPDFFFFASTLDPGASLYEAFTFTNNVPSFRLRESLTCFRATSKSSL